MPTALIIGGPARPKKRKARRGGKRHARSRSGLRRRGPRIEVYWDNPDGPEQGMEVRLRIGVHVYTREVGPDGELTMTEAAHALGTNRMWLYRQVWSGKLKTVRVQGRQQVPLSEIKRLTGEGERVK